TLKSGPQRVRDLLPEAEAEQRLQRRFAVINVWKPISGPVLEMPLAVCDAQSMTLDDFIETDLVYSDRVGEVYSVAFSEAHRWYYVSKMRSDEAMLIKCYDSLEDGRARFTAHSAFRHPLTPSDAPARESIEVRTLAFFE
ncbi:MAG: CmcJ/NvfI family oxidoreductase, partial [Myxococcota bacterium]